MFCHSPGVLIPTSKTGKAAGKEPLQLPLLTAWLELQSSRLLEAFVPCVSVTQALVFMRTSIILNLNSH